VYKAFEHLDKPNFTFVIELAKRFFLSEPLALELAEMPELPLIEL
jgi:hypothetical protein